MYLTVATHARAGSISLMQTLARCLPLRAYYEIFHYSDEYILNGLGPDGPALCQALGLSESARGLRASAVQDPLRLLAALQALDVSTVPVFKVYPHQLGVDAVMQVFGQSSGVLKLARNPLLAYIAEEAARLPQAESANDGAGLKIRFDARALFRFGLAVVQHFDWVDQAAARASVPVATLHYESLIDQADPVHAVLAALRPLLQRAGVEPVPAPLGRPGAAWHGTSPMRQGQDGSAVDKVDNAAEMLAALGHSGLSRYVDATATMQPHDWKQGLARLFEFSEEARAAAP